MRYSDLLTRAPRVVRTRRPDCRYRPTLLSLEDRLMPAGSIAVGGTVQALISALDTANATPGGATLVLPAGSVYTLAAVDNNWYGPNGLPAITSAVTIQGNGAVIQRSPVAGTPAFRLFYVAGGMELPAGSLTL